MNDLLARLIRPHYHALQGYVSAGMEAGKDPEKVFMNANENPFVLPGLEGFNRYPEPQPAKLLQGYAELYGVKPENIIATRGADEAIVILTKLFCEPHKDSVLVTPPTFGMYGVDARSMPAGVVEVPLLKTKNGSFELDADGIIKSVKKGGVKIVYLCSPNNPTANSFDRKAMLRICKEIQGHAVTIIDETYIEFSQQESLTSELKNYPTLLMLRTLSKSYSMAGMRMGCFVSGDTGFISLCKSKCLDAYPLPKASVEAALAVMTPSNLKLAKENRARLLAERDRIHGTFSQSKLVRHIYPSDANFLLIEMDGAKEFVAFCAKKKIILRDFSDKKMTENCIRISPGLPKENDLLFTLLKEFEKEFRQKIIAA